ncbi:MAG: succinate dehydrogenase / fumarate reductase cytochrome b subunit [Saprospiraceae bacterium]|jgi:succinate dehydrogenase / fumarate reductase cytochrome b subunit
MSNSGFVKSSIGRKVLMAFSGFFLIIFLLQHAAINLLSVISPDMFNAVSAFMGLNPIVQFGLQPVLLFGVLFHLGMGFYLEMQNNKARPIKYIEDNRAANASWVSRNMVVTGIMILLFFGVHFYDFWIPEIQTKFIQGNWTGEHINKLGEVELRFHHELVTKMSDPFRSGIYTVAFIFLSLHLQHGFASAFQSAGARHNKYTPTIEKVGKAFAILVPAVFIFIAWFHVINH